MQLQVRFDFQTEKSHILNLALKTLQYAFHQQKHDLTTTLFTTGNVKQNASFNTFEDFNSGSKMGDFVKSLPNKVIILMVVYHRAHVFYDTNAATSLKTICPHAPNTLDERQSVAMICFKGLGRAPWETKNVSTMSYGPAVLDVEITLLKGL